MRGRLFGLLLRTAAAMPLAAGAASSSPASAARVLVMDSRGHVAVRNDPFLASFGYGVKSFVVPPLSPGTYGVRLAATDLAGNFDRITGTLQLTPTKRRPSGGSGTKPSH